MDAWGITLATLRRWYVLLPVLALAVLAALAAGRSAIPEYEASGTALLTPARATAPIANPFVNAEGANNALTIILNGPETRAKLDDRGVNATVTVVATSRTPIFTVRSVASDEETAIGAVNAVIEIAGDELTSRQLAAGVQPAFLIGLQTLAEPSISAVDNNTAIRVQAVILVLGAVVGVVLAVLFDDLVGLVRRRRARGRRRRVKASDGETTPEPTREEVVGEGEGVSVEGSVGTAPSVEAAAGTLVRRAAATKRRRKERPGQATPGEGGESGPDAPPAEASADPAGLEELSTASTGSDK